MPDHGLAASRTPPERINRTTRRRTDQYVLACNTRRDAGDETFAIIELVEQQNRELRAELGQKRELASTRRGLLARSRGTIAACILVGIAVVSGWAFTPDGRTARVVAVDAMVHGEGITGPGLDDEALPHFRHDAAGDRRAGREGEASRLRKQTMTERVRQIRESELTARVAAHENEYVQQYVEALFDEQKELVDQLAAVRSKDAVTGRDVVRNAARMLVFAAAIALAYVIGFSSN